MVTSLPYMGVSIVVVWLLGLSTRPNPLPFPSGVGLSKWIPQQKISSMADALLAYFSMAVGPITTEKFPILHNTEKKLGIFGAVLQALTKCVGIHGGTHVWAPSFLWEPKALLYHWALWVLWGPLDFIFSIFKPILIQTSHKMGFLSKLVTKLRDTLGKFFLKLIDTYIELKV